MNKNKLLSSNDTVKSTNINKKIKVLFIVIAMILSIITINFGISKFRLASKNTVELKFYEYKIAENEIQVSPQEYTQQAVIKITTQKPGTKIQYKLADDSDWISYTNEFVINNNTTISARLVGITEQFEGPVTKKSVTNIAVAKIGEKTYKTVKEAIADCEENAENTETKIEMLADVVEAFEIPVGKNIVLDLNGKTITSDANALTESGNLEATAVVKGTFKLINSEQVENSNQSSSNEQNPKGKLVSQTGIAIKVINQGNFTLGIKETQSEEINVSKVNPVIIGKTNGVVVEDGGKFNFYDGKIISTTTEENVNNSIIGNITETPTNYIAIPKKEGEYEVSTLEKQYIVTFDANGGIASFNTKLVITNQPYGTLPVVEKKEGYEFVCWERKLTETTTETITDTTIVSTQADHIIKAKWNANTYEINYNSNGATGTLENTACTYDKEFTIIQSTPLTKAGYTFKEWNTKQDGTGIAYMPEQKAKNLTSVNNSIVTLYAIWQDTIVPTNTAPTATSTTNTITVQNNQTDEGSGINKSTIEYAICLGENSDGTKQWSKWQSSNIFEQLKSNTQYGIKTKVIDNAGNGPVESEIGIISTQDITNGTLEFYKDTEQGEIIVPETNSSDKLKYINSNIYIKITQSITGTTSYTVKTPEETITTYTENTVISTCAGQYEITLTTTDGTNSKSEKYYINIDKTPPTSIPTYTSTTNTVTVNANAVDDESGVGELVYTIKKEGVELETNTIGEFSGLEDNNTYEVVIIMKDKLENVSTITTTVKTSKLQPGELEFEKSSTSTKFNASNTEDNNVWINENVNISIIESIPGTTTTYMVEKVGETGTKYTENAIITTTDGTYKITLETTDGNNVENVVYYFNIDKTPPTLTLSKITHKDGVYGEDLYNEFYIINIQQSDNSEIDVTKYELGIQTTEYFKTNGTEITENSINVTENGTYTIYTKDIAGNETVKAIEITNIGYDVVYDLNGGTSTQPIANQVKIKGSNLTLTDAKPTKEGYQFKGWATTTNATVPEYVSSGLYTQESKITLYAVWEEVVASATIGEITTYYKSVQTAIEAVSSNNGAIVTLVKNEIHENITVANGQNIILNTNGKTLKPAEGTEEIVISNYGTLTIEGNGIIVNESVDNRCVINNNGNLNLNEIRLKSTNGVAVNNTSTGSININGTEIETSGVGVCNYGNTTVSNGTIIGGIEVNSGKVTVTGGTVGSSNTTYGISAITSGTVIIGDKTTAVDNSVPCIIGKNIGVYVGGTARLEFYDGSIIGESGEGSAINGTVNAIPSGFEVDKVVETVDGVSREIARLSTVAELSSGMVVNAKMKKLSGTANASYSTSNTNIQAILKSDIAPDISTMTSDNIVSNSTIPIYMWFDNGTIYWWSEANKIKCNEFSRSMFYFFHELANIDGISSWDTSSVTNMSYMFYYCRTLTNIEALASWNTSSVTDMSYMFYYCRTLANIEALASWNTSSVINMSNMFYNCRTLTNIEALASWNTSSVINMSNMFYNCNTLTNIEALASWDTSSVTNMSNMFYNCNTLTNIEALASWDTSSVTNMSSMFSGCNTLTNIEALASWNTSSVTDMRYMFYYCRTLANIEALASWDTSSVTNMSYMFYYCRTLANIEALASWNTSSVTNMSNMFYNCNTLTNIEALASWNTSSVINMSNMFSGCNTL
nr:BspA family leucine-rich repeat surface protein [Clostridia bacterium]